ncbi:MAG TPA: helix-turn-helix domain-containing protein [candidate division Zixibacteria bacterium]|nr:helix-turn-helix domain-containing protein [candidate division Zixibacteria bacterium]
MRNKLRNREFLTTSQAAKLLSVSPDTVLKWVKAGKIKSNRTLGGHFRIPASEINIFNGTSAESSDKGNNNNIAVPYQYCWEYLAGGGPIKSECRDCITFRSRASRCYELKDIPGGLGCLNLMCDTECNSCEYFKVVNGQKLNILVLTENQNIIRDLDKLDDSSIFRIRFSEDEYSAAVSIQEYRPDYIIVDCSFGKKRTGLICNNLFNDIRIPVVRIILSSKSKNIRDYCDREVFGWIRKPFGIEQLNECIRGVPR